MKIPPEIQECVVFLMVSSPKHGNKPRPIGTGFFVGVADGKPEGAPPMGMYLITAKHVLDDVRSLCRQDHVYVRLNKGEGSVEIKVPLGAWIGHPTDDAIDVAVMPWTIEEPGMQCRMIPAWRMALTPPGLHPAIANRRDVHLGSEVFIAGLFSSHWGKSRNLPIVRIGHVAMMPGEKIKSTTGDIEAYLIELRSTGGMSGSPMFVRIPSSSWMLGDEYYWIGMILGHWDIQRHSRDAVVTDTMGDKFNMGIALGVPVQQILDVLFQEKLVKQRKKDHEASL